MHTSFIKIVHFSKLVKIGNRLREFNYKKNNNAGDLVFDVDTADERGNRIFFRLQKVDSEWTLSANQPLPDWILQHQQALINELEDGLAHP